MRLRTVALVLVLALGLLATPLPGEAQKAWSHGPKLDSYACPNYRSAGEFAPREAGEPGLCMVQERTRKEGVLLVVDALVENRSPGRVDGVEVSVEFYNFFDELVSLEYTSLLPPTGGVGRCEGWNEGSKICLTWVTGSPIEGIR